MWSEDGPTKPGWYWYRHTTSSTPEIFQAKRSRHGIEIYLDEWRKPAWFAGEWWSERIKAPVSEGQK